MSSGMGSAYRFLRQRVEAALGGERGQKMLAMLGPTKGQPAAVRIVLLGGAVAGLAGLGIVAAGSFAALLLAAAGIYWLLTSVLGLRFSIDPRAVYEAAARAARAQTE